ncbi:MAG: xanthine dehydrogenase family protein molybdopterin-binding subunit [Deltaproteobacteria bacterium]|nr:xanthine dehydrogenase family protein molybdopterin-binding subunit [Deltaproteobacteria bacterium]
MTRTGEGRDARAVGRSVPRVDGAEKVTGRAAYVMDCVVPGMLHAALLRSPLPHARIRRIDAGRAATYPGVSAVVTGVDLQQMPGLDPYFGPAFQDQAILAIDKVRFVGDPVAAVAAATREAAREAAQLIEVEYEELSAVLDVQAALRAGAPLVHERLRPSQAFADLMGIEAERQTNVCYHFKLRRGDVERAFAEAAHVFEDTYTSPAAQHAPLEPHVTVAWVTEGGLLHVTSSTQSPSYVRLSLARIFGLPLSKVRVTVPYLGGGYGAKTYDKLEPVTALLALRTRRPVKLQLTREEEFVTIHKHAVTTRIRTGVAGDGRLLAREVAVYWDSGAYADIAPRVVHKSGYTAAGPYAIPNVKIDSYCVYTNRPPAGAFRGFGVPQVVWAYESQTDAIATRLGLDPVAYRRAHLLREGDLFATGTPMRSLAVIECLDAVAREIEWGSGLAGSSPPAPEVREAGVPRRVLRGKGVAVGIKAALALSISGATVMLNADGSASVLSSTVEMGQGSDTLLAQIVAEALGVRVPDVQVVHPDTAVTPYDTITAATRSTFHMGNAVLQAAARVREQLFAIASDRLEVDPDLLRARDGRVFVAEAEDRGLTIPEVFGAAFQAAGTTLVGEAVYQTSAIPTDHETGQSERVTVMWFVGASAAEVEVDLETGQVRVLRFATAADVGRPINPHHCRQQILGSAVTSIGQTLFECLHFEGGQLTNGSFLDYMIAGYRDVPPIITPIIVERAHPEGPYGAKGVGETGALSVAAAIGNAVHAALGVRLRDLPLTPERVLQAMREREPARAARRGQVERGPG